MKREIRWSGTGAHERIPLVGETVHSRVGPGRVIGYAAYDHGSTMDRGVLWLGVELTLLDPPQWFREQNPGITTAVMYGAELWADSDGNT